MDGKVKRHIERAMSLSAAFGAKNDLTVGKKAKIVSISISYTPSVTDAKKMAEKKANPLLLEDKEMLYVEHLRKEVVRRGFRDEILEQFAKTSNYHIEIKHNFEVTCEIKDGPRGDLDLGVIFFDCTHEGEISFHDKEEICEVLKDAFEAAAYAQGNHDIVSKFNGILHRRERLFRRRWGNYWTWPIQPGTQRLGVLKRKRKETYWGSNENVF